MPGSRRCPELVSLGSRVPPGTQEWQAGCFLFVLLHARPLGRLHAAWPCANKAGPTARAVARPALLQGRFQASSVESLLLDGAERVELLRGPAHDGSTLRRAAEGVLDVGDTETEFSSRGWAPGLPPPGGI